MVETENKVEIARAIRSAKYAALIALLSQSSS